MKPTGRTSISRRRGAALGLAVALPFAIVVWIAFSFDPIGLLLAIASLAAGPISGATQARRLLTDRGALPVLTAGVHAVALGLVAVVLAAAAISFVGNPERAGPHELLSELGLFILYGAVIYGLPALVAIAVPALLTWRALAGRMVAGAGG